MQKRGVSTILMVFELVAAVIVIFATMRMADKIATNEGSKAAFLTKDTALLVDTLYILPGDFHYDYAPVNVTNEIPLRIVRNTMSISSQAWLYEAQFRLGVPVTSNGEAIIGPKKQPIVTFQKIGDEISIKGKNE